MKIVGAFVWLAGCILVTCFWPGLSRLFVGWIALLATVLIFMPYRANSRAPD